MKPSWPSIAAREGPFFPWHSTISAEAVKTIKDMPEHNRPREKLREKGASALTDGRKKGTGWILAAAGFCFLDGLS